LLNPSAFRLPKYKLSCGPESSLFSWPPCLSSPSQAERYVLLHCFCLERDLSPSSKEDQVLRCSIWDCQTSLVIPSSNLKKWACDKAHSLPDVEQTAGSLSPAKCWPLTQPDIDSGVGRADSCNAGCRPCHLSHPRPTVESLITPLTLFPPCCSSWCLTAKTVAMTAASSAPHPGGLACG
jgi:hypothetical protein